MFVKTLVLAALLGAAAAQSSSAAVPTSTAGIDPCILSCLQSAVSANTCSSVTDLACVCSSTAFQEAAAECLASKCTTAEQQAALALQSAECAAAAASSGASSASSGASSASSGASSGAASTSASTTPTTSKSAGAAVRLQRGAVVGVLVALAGVGAGAALVL
ncbi:hypothetical protein IEO21_10144 [Rhodonia placenta]|uniref:CFEM domain-containing protein n=1 Tax=Rhodonia placenta TaxID=104341 RepID=A0A8H7NT26_9APHY|nr:hypothetical protein IEO21_10144 [Postia placenta]